MVFSFLINILKIRPILYIIGRKKYDLSLIAIISALSFFLHNRGGYGFTA